MHDLIEQWDGEFVVVHHDQSTGSTIYIAVHRTVPEASTGGTRIQHYADPRAALRDALRLAGGMTLKFAALDLPRGGGKAVLDVPAGLPDDARGGLLDRYGDLVQSLRGVFQTGPDLGTTPADMDRIAGRTGHVFGTSGGGGDPGPYTARGVLAGIRAAVRHRFGAESLHGRSVVVQGAGHVGGPLARMLAQAGARVRVSDIDESRRDRWEAEGFGWVAPAEALAAECDVLAPCATGGVLSRDTIPALRCAVVAGSANNVLDRPGDAAGVRSRGILYAPDFVINGGGAIYLLGGEGLGWDAATIDAHIRAIGEHLAAIFTAADDEGITTHDAAVRLARRRLNADRVPPVGR